MRIKRKERKGEIGRVLIIGGSEDYVGAVVLAAVAAYRTGVDIVTVAAPERVAWSINNYSPDIITKKFVGKELDITHAKDILSLAEGFDSILIGNGLGIKKELVNKIVRSYERPKVIDADAIKVVNLTLVTNAIFTPHQKEFEILHQNSITRREFQTNDQAIKDFQKVMGANVVLLKGPEDLIFSQGQLFKNKTGNNSMTVGGTGDILAGLCAGFLARTQNMFESAKAAAYANGKTGEFMSKQRGNSYMASEMLPELWRFIR